MVKECYEEDLKSEEEYSEKGGKEIIATKTNYDTDDKDYDPINEALIEVTDNFTKNYQ